MTSQLALHYDNGIRSPVSAKTSRYSLRNPVGRLLDDSSKDANGKA